MLLHDKLEQNSMWVYYHMPSQIALLSTNVFLYIMQCFMIDAAKKINITKTMSVYGYTNANVAFLVKVTICEHLLQS